MIVNLRKDLYKFKFANGVSAMVSFGSDGVAYIDGLRFKDANALVDALHTLSTVEKAANVVSKVEVQEPGDVLSIDSEVSSDVVPGTSGNGENVDSGGDGTGSLEEQHSSTDDSGSTDSGSGGEVGTPSGGQGGEGGTVHEADDNGLEKFKLK